MIGGQRFGAWREQVRLHALTLRRSEHVYGLHPFGTFGKVNPRGVFVVGCPRSGTTFTAGVLGSVAGFADLGEVKPWKAAVPGIYAIAQQPGSGEVVARIRRILIRNQRLAMAAGKRGIEQTPESSFVIPQLAAAFPEAHFVHVLRDGRDVAASLLESGWLGGRRNERDDAGHAFGGYARFWVEPERAQEFEQVSEARRCGWAWRRYVSVTRAALADLDPRRVTILRYEEFVTDAATAGTTVATGLGAGDLAKEFAAGFTRAHPNSVGSFRSRLTPDELADVLTEVGPLLAELGYPLAA